MNRRTSPQFLARIIVVCAAMMTLSVSFAYADVVTQYSFEGDLNDTAAAGTTADNLADNTPGVSYVAGVVGAAVAIPDTADGTNKITAADSADVRLGANWTLEAFVWPDSGNDPNVEWERFWTKWGDGGEDYHLAFRGAANTAVPDGLDMFVNGGSNIINHDSTATVPRETWSHVAFVGDMASGEITAWLNGVQVGSTPYVAVTPTAGTMSFGNFGTGNQAALQYSGYIDEALIHNVAVDAAYLAGRAALIPEPATGLLIVLAAAACLAFRRSR